MVSVNILLKFTKIQVRITLIPDCELGHIESRSIFLISPFIEFIAFYVDKLRKRGIKQFNLHGLFLNLIFPLLLNSTRWENQDTFFLTLKHITELNLLVG